MTQTTDDRPEVLHHHNCDDLRGQWIEYDDIVKRVFAWPRHKMSVCWLLHIREACFTGGRTDANLHDCNMVLRDLGFDLRIRYFGLVHGQNPIICFWK